MRPEQRLAELGLTLPAPPEPAGSYALVTRIGDQLHLAGQPPVRPDGTGYVIGKVGGELTPGEGREAARLAAASALAVLRAELGSLDRLGGIARVVGYVNAAPGFTGMSAVLDGCSDLLAAVLGEPGRAARSAIGVAELPFGIAVEIDVIAWLATP